MTSLALLDPAPRKHAPAAGLFGAIRVAPRGDTPVAANEGDGSFTTDPVSGIHRHPLRDQAPMRG